MPRRVATKSAERVVLRGKPLKQARQLLETGDFATIERVVERGLQLAQREMHLKAIRDQQLRDLVAAGLHDIANGRVSKFDDASLKRIIAKGRTRLDGRRQPTPRRKAS